MSTISLWNATTVIPSDNSPDDRGGTPWYVYTIGVFVAFWVLVCLCSKRQGGSNSPRPANNHAAAPNPPAEVQTAGNVTENSTIHNETPQDTGGVDSVTAVENVDSLRHTDTVLPSAIGFENMDSSAYPLPLYGAQSLSAPPPSYESIMGYSNMAKDDGSGNYTTEIPIDLREGFMSVVLFYLLLILIICSTAMLLYHSHLERNRQVENLANNRQAPNQRAGINCHVDMTENLIQVLALHELQRINGRDMRNTSLPGEDYIGNMDTSFLFRCTRLATPPPSYESVIGNGDRNGDHSNPDISDQPPPYQDAVDM